MSKVTSSSEIIYPHWSVKVEKSLVTYNKKQLNKKVTLESPNGVVVKFKRLIGLYLWQIFLPSGLLITIMTGFLFVPSKVFADRLTLAMTAFLSLIAIFIAER